MEKIYCRKCGWSGECDELLVNNEFSACPICKKRIIFDWENEDDDDINDWEDEDEEWGEE